MNIIMGVSSTMDFHMMLEKEDDAYPMILGNLG
jgi:hypothetical protein